MKKLIVIIVLFSSFLNASAQQEVMVSQYMFNGLFLNPAYAGSHKYFSSSLTYRKQWVKFEGAPTTYLLAVDGPLFNDKMGVGLILANDQIGVANQTDIYANYSYFVKLGPGKLGFGLKAGVSQYSAKVDDLIVNDEDDPLYAGVTKSAMLPKFGFGTYYYTSNWFVGFSIPTLFASDPKLDYAVTARKTATIQKHYYVNAGYVFKVSRTMKLKPTALVKKEKASPMQIDASLTAFFMDRFSLGVTYRSKDAMSAMITAQLTKKLRLGYAYDITTTDIKIYSKGSHEVMLSYIFGKDKVIKKITPRFF